MTSLGRRASLVLAFVGLVGCDIPQLGGPDAGAEDTGPNVDDALDGERCEGFEAQGFTCGGDPVGRWRIASSCPGADAYDPLRGLCPELQSDGTGAATGTVEFFADGSYELRIETRSLDIEFDFPLACFGGATEPCSGASFDGATCELFSDLCACDVELARGMLYEDGDWYAIADRLLLQTPEENIDGGFCRVSDEVMRFVRYGSAERDELTWAFILERTPFEEGTVAP